MVSRTAIGLIDAYTGNSTLAGAAFDQPTTLETGAPASGWVTRRTVTFTAYGPASAAGSFLFAIAHRSIPAGTADVLYDDEDWSLTPKAEQRDPGTYMRRFVAAAHAAGYAAILAPAVDLARAMPCYRPADSAAVNYVDDCAIPSLVGAAGPDVYEVQAQLYQSDTSLSPLCDCYAWLVLQSVREARLASPAGTALLDVLAGLSTNQAGRVAAPATLETDTSNTSPADVAAAVNGYWLNLPERGTACPQCVPGGAPQVAVAYLESLGYPS